MLEKGGKPGTTTSVEYRSAVWNSAGRERLE